MAAKNTSVLISASEDLKTDKSQAAINWNIPVLSANWILQCLQKEEKLAYDDFLIKGVKKRIKITEGGQKKRICTSHAQASHQGSSNTISSETGDSFATKPNSSRVLGKPTTPLNKCVVCVSGQLQVSGDSVI